MNRLEVFFGFTVLVLLKMLMCFGTLFVLILFSPIFLLINKKVFLKVMDELNQNLK